MVPYTPEILADVQERSHRCLQKLLDHCRQLTPEELNRHFDGFGDDEPNVRMQFHHELTATRYWIGVLQGKMILDEDAPNYPTIDALEGLRREQFEKTLEYLRGASVEELSTPRVMTTWRGERTLVPAHILMRIAVHFYHHQGKILVMCRLLGKPGALFDYPLE